MTPKQCGTTAVMCMIASMAFAQRTRPAPSASSRLQLSAEVATTTEEGYPSSVQVTITNIASASAIMPVLREGICTPERGIRLEMTWAAADRRTGSGKSFNNCVDSGLPVSTLIRKDWVLLRPGESMTETIGLRGRYSDYQPGTITYRIEYLPPAASPQDLAGQAALGYFIPTESLSTPDQSFDIQ